MSGVKHACRRLHQVSQPLHWELLHKSILGLGLVVDNLIPDFTHPMTHRVIGHPILLGLVQARNLVVGVPRIPR